MMKKTTVGIMLALSALFSLCSHDERKVEETTPDVTPEEGGYCQLVVESDSVTRVEIRDKEQNALQYFAILEGNVVDAPVIKIKDPAEVSVAGGAHLSYSAAFEGVYISARRLRLENATPDNDKPSYCNLKGKRYTVVSSRIKPFSPR